jgi:hypothetical protein
MKNDFVSKKMNENKPADLLTSGIPGDIIPVYCHREFRLTKLITDYIISTSIETSNSNKKVKCHGREIKKNQK